MYGGRQTDGQDRRVGYLRHRAVTEGGGSDDIAAPRLAPHPRNAALEPHQRAVLCLHGFTGTPFEIQPVAHALTGLGYHVETPMLAGHGGSLAALEATDAADWLRSAEQAFDALAARTPERIAVVGFSMGGLLALRLGRSRRDRIAALAVLSAPMRLRPVQVKGIKALGYVPRALRFGPLRAIPKLFGSNVGDPEVRRSNPALRAMPLSCLRSLIDLMADTHGDLDEIHAPALIVHGRKDRTVPISASFELADRLERRAISMSMSRGASPDGSPVSSRVVERLWLDRSRHLVGIDVEQQIVSERIGSFLTTRGCW